MKKTVTIKGMMCEHCQKRVVNALSELDGVQDVIVDLDAGTAVFSAEDAVTDGMIIETIDDAGYDIISIE